MVDDPLLTLAEAAKLLGYKPSGLRKIVNHTKHGKPGAKIRFFQVGQGPIKIRRSWIEEFIESNTVQPPPILRSPVQKRKPKQPEIYRLGFDPALFWENQPWAK